MTNGLISSYPAIFNNPVKFFKRSEIAHFQNLLFELTVMTNDPIKRLQRKISLVEPIEYAHALDVMEKPAPRVFLVHVI